MILIYLVDDGSNETTTNVNGEHTEKLDSLFSVQISPQMARATTSNVESYFTSYMLLLSELTSDEISTCVEFNEPIFMVKTHDLTERLSFGTIIDA